MERFLRNGSGHGQHLCPIPPRLKGVQGMPCLLPTNLREWAKGDHIILLVSF